MSHMDHSALHPLAREGIRLMNAGAYFEAHEALEDAWREEPGEIRELYRGILQAAVAYLHITRGNAEGAIKVAERAERWLSTFPSVCRGVDVAQLRADLQAAVEPLRVAPPQFEQARLKPVRFVGEDNESA